MDYTVKHYKQNLDGSYSLTSDTETLKALTGSTVTVSPKEYDGFTFDEESVVEIVEADGSLVLELYYTRNEYTLTIKSEGTVIWSNNFYMKNLLSI